MDKMWFKARRWISVLLVFAMLTSVMPVQAFAEEVPAETPAQTTETNVPEVPEQTATEPPAEEPADVPEEESVTEPVVTEPEGTEPVVTEPEVPEVPDVPEKPAEPEPVETKPEEPEVSAPVEAEPEVTEPAAPAEQEQPAEQPAAAPVQEPAAEEEPAMVTYTVRYLDKATEASVYEDATGEGAVGDTITITVPPVEGYTVCADQPTELVLAADTENTATVYYEVEAVAMPAQTLSASAADGATVTIVAPEGALPEGTTVQIVKMDTVPALPGVEYTEAVAYDVTLLKDGAEVQPAVEVSVTLSNVPMDVAPEDMEVYHKADDGTVDEGTVQADKSADFSLDSFCPFVVVNTGESADAGVSESANEPEISTYGMEDRIASTRAVHKDGGNITIVRGDTSSQAFTQMPESNSDIVTFTQDDDGLWHVKGLEVGETTITVTTREWWGLEIVTTYYVEVTDPTNQGPQKAYFYALKTGASEDSNDDKDWYLLGQGTINTDGITLNWVNNVVLTSYDVGNVQQSDYPTWDTMKTAISTYYQEEVVDFSLTPYKITFVSGAAGTDAAGMCYHVDVVVSLETVNTVSYQYMVAYGDGPYELYEGGANVAKNTQVTLASPAPEITQNGKTYIFEGWYENSSNGEYVAAGSLYTVKNSVIFYGRYREKDEQYTISYETQGNGSVSPGSETVVKGENAKGSTATPSDGYYFVEWVDENNKHVSSDETYVPQNVQGDATYYAVFKQKTELTITIQDKETTYDGQEQSGYGFVTSDEGKSVVTGLKEASHYVERITGYTPASGTYVTNADTVYRGIVDKNPTAVVKDASGKDVSEQYTVNIIPGTLTIKGTVTYDWNTEEPVTINGQEATLPTAEQTYEKDETITVPTYSGTGTPMAGAGKEFVGWSTDPKATVADASFTMGDASMKLYAVWKDKEVTVPVKYFKGEELVSDLGEAYPAQVETTYSATITVGVVSGQNLVLPKTMDGGYVLEKVISGGQTVFEYTNANKDTASGSVANVTDTTTIEVYYGKDSNNNGVPDAYDLTVTIANKTVTYNGQVQSGYDWDDEIDENTPAMTAVLGTDENISDEYIVTVDNYQAPSSMLVTEEPLTGNDTDDSASPVTVTVLKGAENVTAKYAIEFVPGTLTVTPISTPITVRSYSETKPYDGTPLKNSNYQVEGETVLLTGDRLVVTVTGSVTNVAQGDVENTVDAKVMRGETDVTSCYTLTVQAGTLYITPREITITAKNAYKVEGESDPTPWEVDIAGDEKLQQGADSLDGLYSVTCDHTEAPGTYPIVVKATDQTNENYTLHLNAGKFTIFADQEGDKDTHGKDGTPDDFQTIFQYVSGGNGTVSGTVYETHSNDQWQETWQNPVHPTENPDADITVTPASGYRFDHIADSNGKTYASLEDLRKSSYSDDMVFTVYFTAVNNLSYTVRYLEDNTARELASPKTVGGQTLGTSVTEYALDIAGYSLMSDANPQTITIGTGENIITFYYRAIGPETPAAPTTTETPTPLVLPTTPTAPTTPTTPTTPAGPTVTAAPEEEVEAPAEEEEVPEEETPLAPEAGEEEAIGEEETPLAGGNAAWALLNLILTILTVLGSLILLIGYLGKKRKEGNEEYTVKKHGFWRVASLVPAIGAIIAFILTEDMSQPMVFVDRWTLLMVIIAVIQIVIAVLSMKDKQEPDEDDAANA